jgi:hypothetical protein
MREDLCQSIPFPGCSSPALISHEKTCSGREIIVPGVFPVNFGKSRDIIFRGEMIR